MKKKYLEWIFYSVLIVTISAMVSVLIVSGSDYGAWNYDYTNEYESGEDLSFEDESGTDASDENTTVEQTTKIESSTIAETTTKQETTTEKKPDENYTESVLVSVSDNAVVNSDSFSVTISTQKNDSSAILEMFKNKKIEIYDSDGFELDNDVYVGTGCVIRLYNGDEYTEYTVIVMCDIDGNGKITANDARETLRASVMLTVLNEIQTIAGNVNNDDKLTASDARRVLRRAAGLDL